MIRTLARAAVIAAAGWIGVTGLTYVAMTYGGVWTDDHTHHL